MRYRTCAHCLISPRLATPVTSMNLQTHHTMKLTIVDHLGEHDGGTAHVHVSRQCLNCDSYAPTSGDDWDAEADGPCMNLCTAAEHANDGAYCPDHQSKQEFEAGIHRSHVPLFNLIQGGAQ